MLNRLAMRLKRGYTGAEKMMRRFWKTVSIEKKPDGEEKPARATLAFDYGR